MIFRRIMYFVLIYAVLTYNVLYRTYDGFIMLVFTGAVSILSLVMLVLARLTMRYQFAEDVIYVERKQEFGLKYYLKNKMPFPVTMADILFDGLKKPQAFSISAGNVAIVTKKDCKEHCGCYDVSAGRIRLYDFFRIVRFKIKNTGVVKVVALPRLFDVNTEEYIYGMLCCGMDNTRASQNTGEVNGVREYRDGDRIKDIHHKLSSRTSQLMVKEYSSEEGSDDCFIFYNGGEAAGDTRDGMLELMYNIMYLRLRTKGRTNGYILNAGGAEHVLIDSKEMLDLFFERILDGVDECMAGEADIPSGAQVFAVSFTTELCSLCMQARSRGWDIVLYMPEAEREQAGGMDTEVVYVSAGGGAA